MAFPLIKALPRDHKVYYRYPGSLTTPPCHESVTWTVFENHISISQAQVMIPLGVKLILYVKVTAKVKAAYDIILLKLDVLIYKAYRNIIYTTYI